MKNQTLHSLAVINRRIQNNRHDNFSFQEIIDSNRTEIDFLVNKFNLKEEEALILASACIYTIVRNSPEFDIDDLASRLEVNNFEVLLQQKHLKSLIEKEFLVESPKECNRYTRNTKFAVDIMNKEFALHASFGEHLSQ